ncbi:MAG: HPr family phosphocarrier protein [Planctomycetes bacterium]|nr:HPr family phosphocarrier protein [Planctomycetota bacterium]MCB9868509.1 HPr family phosphocarrier protein [Planctomycetota bacterium]
MVVDPANQAATAEVTLANANGLHARPAHMFVQTANGFASNLRVRRIGMEYVDGKSIMGVMLLAAEKGAVLELESRGPDCVEQIRALRELVENGFGED